MESRAPERTETSSGSIVVAKFFADRFFDFSQCGFDFGLELWRIAAVVRVKVAADFRCDGEPRRDWQTDPRHLGEVCSLAAEQRFHFAATVRLTIAEVVDVFGFRFLRLGAMLRC